MSHEATNWAVKLKGLRPIAKIVLWHLSDCHNPIHGCFPTQDYLAEMAEVSRASVNRILSELEHAGIIRRELRVDPESKRRLATRYRLAFEKGFEPLDVESHVTGLDMEENAGPCLKNDEIHVSNSAVSMSHSSETLTSNRTGKGTCNSPQPPENGGRGFADLWNIWPEDRRGRRDNSQGAFTSLSKLDREAAIDLAEAVIIGFARQKRRLPALVAYLRKRIFAEYVDAPQIDSDGYFVSKPGTPEWNEWLGYMRRKHGDGAVEKIVRLGYFRTKTRWPEAEPA